VLETSNAQLGITALPVLLLDKCAINVSTAETAHKFASCLGCWG